MQHVRKIRKDPEVREQGQTRSHGVVAQASDADLQIIGQSIVQPGREQHDGPQLGDGMAKVLLATASLPAKSRQEGAMWRHG